MERVLALELDPLSLVADKGDLSRLTELHAGETESSVDVGHGALGGILHEADACADQGLSLIIDDGTGEDESVALDLCTNHRQLRRHDISSRTKCRSYQ